MRLRTQQASELDNSARWNQRLRPWFDVEGFQERINTRVGVNRDGRPIIRLVWGQDALTTAYNETTPRYWTRRQRKYPDGFTWWTVPRWIFERRLEPEQYVTAWNAKRYSLKDPTQSGLVLRCEECGSSAEPKIIGGKLYCSNCAGTQLSGGAVIDKGPPPAEYYVFMMEAARHEAVDPSTGWAACCTRQFYTDRMRCWGQYRHPNDFDLEVLSQSARMMEAAKNIDPYAPLTLAQMEEAELAANMQVERADEQMRLVEQEMIQEVYKHWMRQPSSISAGVSASQIGKDPAQEKRAISRILEAGQRQIT